MKQIKSILLAVIMSIGILSPLTIPTLVTAQADIQDGLCQGVNLEVSEGCVIEDSDSTEAINQIIEDVINIFSLVVGVIAVIMIIVGGLKYITSGGDSGNVTGAKNTILYAVVGLVIVALAQVIVRFVLNKATDASTI